MTTRTSPYGTVGGGATVAYCAHYDTKTRQGCPATVEGDSQADARYNAAALGWELGAEAGVDADFCPEHRPKATCRACQQPLTLLGGDWTDPDGCTNCMADLSAVYAPHRAETEGA